MVKKGTKEAEIEADDSINLVGVACPENSMRATLRLDTMDDGEILEMLLSDSEAITTFVPNLEREGYQILLKARVDASTWRVLVLV